MNKILNHSTKLLIATLKKHLSKSLEEKQNGMYLFFGDYRQRLGMSLPPVFPFKSEEIQRMRGEWRDLLSANCGCSLLTI